MGAPVVFICVFAIFGTILMIGECFEYCSDRYDYADFDYVLAEEQVDHVEQVEHVEQVDHVDHVDHVEHVDVPE